MSLPSIVADATGIVVVESAPWLEPFRGLRPTATVRRRSATKSFDRADHVKSGKTAQGLSIIAKGEAGPRMGLANGRQNHAAMGGEVCGFLPFHGPCDKIAFSLHTNILNRKV